MNLRTAAVGGGVWAMGLATLLAATDVKVTPLVTNGRVFTSFAAPSAFTSDAREVVRSGLQLTLTFSVELRRPSTVWFDHTLSAATVAAQVKFDNLTRDYQVSKQQEGRVVWSDHTADEGQMRTWVTAFDGIPLEPTEPLEPNVDYYVRVRLRASPRLSFSFWPFGRDDGSGRKDFTFIR
jgi:hypothetical protein